MPTRKQLAALKKGRAALKKKRAAKKSKTVPSKKKRKAPARRKVPARKRATTKKKNPVRPLEYLVSLRSPTRKGTRRKTYYLQYRDGKWIFHSIRPLVGWSKAMAKRLANAYGIRALKKMKSKGWELSLDSKKK